MADHLSERLGLPGAAEVAQRAHGKARWDGWTAAAPDIEADRRATVEAVVRWLRERDMFHAGGLIERCLLAPSDAEGEQ